MVLHLEKFNDTFQEFLNDLCVAYPSDGEFRICKTLLGTALLADKSLIHRFFYNKIVCQYENHIAERNDQFFLAKDYSGWNEKISGANRVIDKIKLCWADMSDENKDVVWRYMRVLTALAKKVVQVEHTRT